MFVSPSVSVKYNAVKKPYYYLSVCMKLFKLKGVVLKQVVQNLIGIN